MRKPVNVSVRANPKKNEHPEKLIRRFMKKVKKERVMERIREKRFYIKPSEKRRRDKERNIRNSMKNSAKKK